jgi:hypothetical protein
LYSDETKSVKNTQPDESDLIKTHIGYGDLESKVKGTGSNDNYLKASQEDITDNSHQQEQSVTENTSLSVSEENVPNSANVSKETYHVLRIQPLPLQFSSVKLYWLRFYPLFLLELKQIIQSAKESTTLESVICTHVGHIFVVLILKRLDFTFLD